MAKIVPTSPNVPSAVAATAVWPPAGFIALVVFASGVATLLVIDCVSWRRTALLRRGGHGETEPEPAHRIRTSWLTAVPAGSGFALLGFGVATMARSLRGWPLAACSCVAGAFVAISGTLRRVATIEASGEELLIRYGRSPPFRLPWDEIATLQPPGWPLGGWRVEGRHVSSPAGGGSGRHRTLMPTDLWGRPDVLRAIVTLSGLRFDGRAWRRPARSGHEMVMLPCIWSGCTSQWKK